VHVPFLVSLQGLLIVSARFFFAGIPWVEVFRRLTSVEFAKGSGPVHDYWAMQVEAERELKIMKFSHYFAGRTEWDKSVISVVNSQARYYHTDEVLRAEFYGCQWRPTFSTPFVIYTTGGAAPYKGLINLLEAVELLRESRSREIKLRVAGRIQGTNMWPLVTRAMRRLRLNDVVTWLGPLSADAIAAELEHASLYVHPSLIDNSPNALAEAMIVGVPCIASSVGGIPSMVRDGIDGLLYGPNDVYSLAGRIAAIEADPSLAASLGNNARERAQQRHNPEAIAKATMEMYTDVIARYRTGER
jgi:glycosyltransferase involved in cell wall biosynthesis